MKVICSVAQIDLIPKGEFELFVFAGAAQLCRKLYDSKMSIWKQDLAIEEESVAWVLVGCQCWIWIMQLLSCVSTE